MSSHPHRSGRLVIPSAGYDPIVSDPPDRSGFAAVFTSRGGCGGTPWRVSRSVHQRVTVPLCVWFDDA
ncbi:MAG: hypothetical protein QG622_2151 [Actinomycetota bacterium]|nr:hypothetical protein [Actinomycetota bacterium]